MASCTQRRVYSFVADGTLVYGQVVKYGTDDKHCGGATAVSDRLLGIVQTETSEQINDTVAAGDQVEVALPGGGAKGLAGGTIAAGDWLTTNSSGSLVSSTTTADRVIGIANQSAVSGDIFSLEVVSFLHY